MARPRNGLETQKQSGERELSNDVNRQTREPREIAAKRRRNRKAPSLSASNGDLSRLGNGERNSPQAKAPCGPSERARACHWAAVRCRFCAFSLKYPVSSLLHFPLASELCPFPQSTLNHQPSTNSALRIELVQRNGTSPNVRTWENPASFKWVRPIISRGKIKPSVE